ncbi:hypothetical protein LY90DRAFT_513813 [Neocallimastix californiae]|uniref:MULE transposase domain-containing protein n=1 Tax=Neocallimastix californiae TaxID=1754190 RepID=A0A1Y2AV12_9FUNG|nr:hypothetical protein LY90DRAFT_513813 [Neocallimastix californiae]|eukprot:ORY26284.1 hypothetical protein LY90DRAFT_513813 [Neocallimastix californiae]
MEENITIYISESNKGEEQIIINKQYKFNFSHSRKDNSRVYKCTEYKKNNKCKSFIILNNEKEILKYESLHNHPGNEYSVSLSVMKHKIKDEIKKHSNPFDIKRKRLYNEISKEMGFIYPCPEYISVKTLILRSINKKLPSNVTTFNEIPNESEYYKTERNEDFMIFKNSDLVIFQSPFQAKLFKKYNNDIFVDGTFYIAPKFSQQVFITRTYVKELNSFYTTSYAILRNKKQKTYKMLFNKLKQNSNNNIITEPKNVHCDFEKGISKAVKKIFPNINIKYCIWHYKNLLEIKKNELCRNEVNDDEKIFNYYKGISNLPFINPEYIMDIFSLIKTKSIEKNSCQFLKFLEYFYETYLIGYDMKIAGLTLSNIFYLIIIFYLLILIFLSTIYVNSNASALQLQVQLLFIQVNNIMIGK